MSEYKTRCFARVWTGTEHRSCHNTATLEYSGFHWCRLHHPPTVEEKQRKREEKQQAEWAEREAMFEHYHKEERLKIAARDFLREHHPDVYQRLRKEVGL